jgi:hypothetical protein
MNCRDFLNEFEDRNGLSDMATLHLKDCADCQKINVVQSRVWQLIDKFEPATAPNDFDFRVKARIAGAKPADFQPSIFPFLRYALGLSVVGLILAFVVFNGVYSIDDKTAPPIASSNFKPTEKEIPTVNSSPSEQIAEASVPPSFENEKPIIEITKPKSGRTENKKQPAISEKETLLAVVKSPEKLQINNTKEDDNSGGSQVQSLKPAISIMPKGMSNSTQIVENPSSFEQVNSMTAEQILSVLGIQIVSENGKRQVKKIKPNSAAEHSGVKVGDLIEAIDDEKLTSEPIRSKTVQGKKLTVMRGTERREIPIHN